ncbi:MAG: B12-binding domain-containing radical SAM protein [Planctomycetes bacterium]|nr:B12-binding domain-containing radical SAM protein [Planctomycetota bacterium]
MQLPHQKRSADEWPCPPNPKSQIPNPKSAAMHLVLVSPTSYAESFPIGLAYLAANLRPADTAEVLDAGALGLDVRQTAERVLAAKPRVVGMSYMTYQAEWCYELSKRLKEAAGNLVIVHGGIHASVLPDDALAHGADCVVIGEGEETLVEALDRVRAGQGFGGIAGLCFKQPGTQDVVTTMPRPLIKDLDKLAPPRWDAFDLKLYHETIHVVPGAALPIMASRGCAFNCSFCSSLWKQKVRYRTLDNVMAELKGDITRHGIRKYHFYDDNLLINLKFTEALCRRILDEGLNIEWCCEARVGDINRNPAVLDLLAEAGCKGIEIGVESLDETVLEKTNKRQTTDDSFQAFEHLRRSGVQPIVLLMTCNIGETIAGHHRQNRGLTRMTGRHSVFWGQYATPFPGSKFHDDAKQDGLVLAERWSDYVTRQMNFVPNSLLNDVPVRNRRWLNPLDRLFCRVALSRAARVTHLPPDIGVSAPTVYPLIDGTRTVRAIADEFVRVRGTPPKTTLQEIVKVIIALAQLGLIGSAAPNGQTKPYGLAWLLGLAFTQLRRYIACIQTTVSRKT